MNPGGSRAALRIWRLGDGKPGHENQARGLIEAIAARVEVQVDSIMARRGLLGATRLARSAEVRALGAPPALIVGAGHATHLSMLALARAHGGSTVVLMRPSLPVALFDHCIAPAHDHLPPGPRVLLTRGALNRVRPQPPRDPTLGLVLLGGPSRRHRWDEDQVVGCVSRIVATPLRWQVVTSRRTPRSTSARIMALEASRIEMVEPSAVDDQWLARQLGRAHLAWVTTDSVSMVYEALSGGAAVGLIEIPAVDSRGDRAGAELAARERVTRFADWCAGAALAPAETPLAEADRAARWLLAAIGR